jgi:hypothetical protein
MSDTVRSVIPLTQVLLSANKTRRKVLLDSLSPRETDALCELVLNGIAGPGRSNISEDCLRHCRRHKDHIRTLAYGRGVSWRKRRDLLRSQSGSGWFLPLLASVVTSLLAK